MMNISDAFEKLPDDARAVIYKKAGELAVIQELSEGVFIATLPEILEIVRNAGFTIVGPCGKQYN